jgi:hypothetical protein
VPHVPQGPRQPGFNSFFMPATGELAKAVWGEEPSGTVTQGLAEEGGFKAFGEWGAAGASAAAADGRGGSAAGSCARHGLSCSWAAMCLQLTLLPGPACVAAGTLLGEDSLLVVKDPARHAYLRALLQPAFGPDAVASYLPDIEVRPTSHMYRQMLQLQLCRRVVLCWLGCSAVLRFICC